MPDDPRSSEPASTTAPDDRGDLVAPTVPPEEMASIDDSTGLSRRSAVVLGLAAVVVAVLLIVAFTRPHPTGPVATDRLGPAQGEQVADYLADARASLDGTDADPRWALVSFAEYRTPQQLPAAADGLRISGVIQHVPIDRVQTPVVTVAVPAGDEPTLRSADAAAGLLESQQVRDARGAEVVRVSASRLRAGCACTAGIVVRGTLSQLRDLAAAPGIRAVQALPADAVAGRFAVSPLLPESAGAITPTPDDGPVPAE
ncbi:hypothetical protein [Nocardia caishijiensis]|nr:hypothetical protein [Nocardia caishijiensis]